MHVARTASCPAKLAGANRGYASTRRQFRGRGHDHYNEACFLHRFGIYWHPYVGHMVEGELWQADWQAKSP